MDPRRTSRVIDPKVRKVGFFAPQPFRTLSGPADLPPVSSSLSPVMIPPARHASDNLTRAVGVPVPVNDFRRSEMDYVPVGSYNPGDSVLGTSPVSSSRVGDGEFSEDLENWSRSDSRGMLPMSLPSNGLDMMAVRNLSKKVANEGKGGDRAVSVESDSKSLKEKTTKAERRALQEAQRAAKAAAKGSNAEGKVSIAATVREPSVQAGKAVKQPKQKKDGPVASSEKKGGDRPSEKDRKKDVPPPRMQFDDKTRVEKAKKRSVVKQIEARNRVEFFLHLPQYERGTQLPDLETKFFQSDHIHPAVYKVGLQYLAGDITGGNARCIAMLQAFQKALEDYSAPSEKTINRDLIAKINGYISFLIECRPLSISMGNAIRFLKAHVTRLPSDISESEAKASISSDIDRFITEKIVLADKIIVGHAVAKIRGGDVLLTYGSSSVVEMILLRAHELGTVFRVVVVDSRPKLEGQALVRRLVQKGVNCTYTHINAISYIMHEITRVFLGAASVLSNGTVYSRVGTACVAMVAHEFRVPVMICCEAYKFHERVQLDSICCNELGDPGAISKVPGEVDNRYFDDSVRKDDLQLLNLLYDATPSDYVSVIITDYGMIPATSVPVIIREYGGEYIFT
ncbi:Translation initiation factor eIF-2B subunit delta [Heracleum sosnowskyi]|uniref:Translation initiation factor eIF2B subunit delta n=1 Tax=Heracleum sosnowskyi TaxID=360622 RepID=A0AAD8MST4_9APIA|nr:Translation initiation factor eIF-2B subunit delta [Heracleum sosnowskyi]